ncbi:MAG: response regulator [Planctomycetes bacterium]|nr:response regulator [Planctomycetota bacterium]
MTLRLFLALWRPAVVLFLVGGIVFFAYVSETRRVEVATQNALDLSSLTWKVNETIFETHRLELALHRYMAGDLSLDTLRMRVDILWSRIDVIDTVQSEASVNLQNMIETYRAFLSELDTTIIRTESPPTTVVAPLQEQLAALVSAFRKIWIVEFLQQHRSIVQASAYQSSQDALFQNRVVVVALAFLVIYLLVECLNYVLSANKERGLRQEANLQNEAKSIFVAKVSHEIRTPLNGVLGMAQLLSETSLTEAQRKMVGVILTSGELLQNTINDILDMSKIASADFEIISEPFDVAQLGQQLLVLHEHTARNKNLTLKVIVDPNLPKHAVGDAMRISQVLNNLISNALKFTETGYVTVSLRVDLTSATGAMRLVASVQDSGPGLSETDVARVFEPFYQAGGSVEALQRGTGLGLSISSALCRAMGGTLSVVSTVGRGSCFTASFELKAIIQDEPSCMMVEDVWGKALLHRIADMRAAQQEHGLDSDKLSILIVDDGEVNRRVLRAFATPLCSVIDEAKSGEEAVSKAEESYYDVIFMDINMPGIGGLAATAAIRENVKKRDAPTSAVIAVTANVMTHQLKQYLECGLDHTISKPVRKADLTALLSYVRSELSKPRSQTAGTEVLSD